MGELVILTATDGDRRIPWDPNDMAQVRDAQRRFHELLGAGYRAYAVGRRGQRGERILEFDPTLGEVLFTARHGYSGG
jgi:hypothetical protein